MFSLAIEGDDGELYYWSGGEIWSVRPEEAARFVQETGRGDHRYAKKAWWYLPAAHLCPSPSGRVRRPAEVIANAVKVMKIATSEIEKEKHLIHYPRSSMVSS